MQRDFINDGVQVRSDGEGVLFIAEGALPGAQASLWESRYAATRGPSSWGTVGLAPPGLNVGALFMAMSWRPRKTSAARS